MAEKKKPTVALATIIRTGEKLVIPSVMTIPQAIDLLNRQLEYEQEQVSISRTINCYPWDGAIALGKAMQELFGWATAEPTRSFFGNDPPQLIDIEVGFNKHTTIVWGEFSLPGVTGRVSTGYTVEGTPPITKFVAQASVKRMHEEAVQRLFDLTEDYARHGSIYRGQAIKIRFLSDSGKYNPLAAPRFIDLSNVKPDELVFSRDVEASIATNLFTVLEHPNECKEAGIPLKRGILFEGPYGVGKSLTANVTAYKAVTNNWTFLYCERANELQHVVNFARQYQPAVIFCEDIDRVVSGERSVSMDDILNVIDGIESKGADIVIVLTTNYVGKINKAMLRPGRLDAIISVTAPDHEAVARLIAQYSRGQLIIKGPADEKLLHEASTMLAGKVPAAIRECVERAKLSALKLSGGTTAMITPAALVDSAISMKTQFAVMAPSNTEALALQTREEFIQKLSETLVRGLLVEAEDNLCMDTVSSGEE